MCVNPGMYGKRKQDYSLSLLPFLSLDLFHCMVPVLLKVIIDLAFHFSCTGKSM